MPRSRTSPRDKILLVEGKDDREVIYQFCNKCRIDNRELFGIQDKDGIESLIATLKLQVKIHNLKVLAAVIDADSNLQERWKQLQNVLTHEGYTLPNKPATAGTICEPSRLGRPRLGLWIMPDNELTGMLEDFLIMLIPTNEARHARAEQVVASTPVLERRFGPTKTRKAVLHTWLAWQEEPGPPMGQAMTKRYLDPKLHPAPAFEAWLRELFVP